MKTQAIVIGLGQFGMALARALAEGGAEVIAVDKSEARVQAVATWVTSALCFDATDEMALAQTAPPRRDLCVCAIGDESREGSIICTALFKQLGAERIVARATDPVHERILRLVGAHEVVNPERAFGARYATRLLYSKVIDEVPLGPDLVITELQAPDAIVGRSLIDLSLPRRFSITVVALRTRDGKTISTPDPKAPIGQGDILVVVAPSNAVVKFLDRLG